MSDFYNRIAKKYGGYGFSNAEPTYRSVYADGNPEEIFYEKVKKHSQHKSSTLDIGCGDGIFAFKLADKTKDITGLDSSINLINIANAKKEQLLVDNVQFVYGDAAKMTFTNNSFDLIYNRRGPSFYAEYSRVLSLNGHYVEIGIGEQDAKELKQVFGRGQDFGKWSTSRRLSDIDTMRTANLQILFSKDYIYDEYYASVQEFILFLQGVPIFEDFDAEKDSELLRTYCKAHSNENGEVKLTRHRVVYVALKK